jgi:uncharacterized iron-regulated protein
MLAGARIVFVGETHDSAQSHQAELEILRGLQDRFPGQLAIGLEMFRQPQQALLDQWLGGALDETDFLEAVQWKRAWGFDFGLYRPILELARAEHIELIALNPSEDLQRKLREHAPEQLAPEERAALPEMGEVDPLQRELLRAIYESHAKHGRGFDAFLRLQLFWEEAMAERAVAYLKQPEHQQKRLVTLTGGFHVRYGLGLPKKVLRRLAMPYATVLTEGEDSATPLEVELPEVPLAPADFFWRPEVPPHS